MTGNLPLDEVEKEAFWKHSILVAETRATARRLGITRKTLRKKLTRYEQGGC